MCGSRGVGQAPFSCGAGHVSLPGDMAMCWHAPPCREITCPQVSSHWQSDLRVL